MRTLVTMIGRMKMNTFTFRESFDRAPYRKNACVFESRFPIHALRAFLVHISAAPDNALTIPTGATGIPTAAQNVMISAWETEDSDGEGGFLDAFCSSDQAILEAIE